MASGVSRNYNLTASYGTGFDSVSKITYQDVQKGIERGECSLKLWREFKGVKCDEMAGMLDISEKSYKAIENGVNPSSQQVMGICWYLDIHPTDLPVQNSIDMPNHYLEAIIAAHNNPSCWPHDSEETQNFTLQTLEAASRPSISYDELKKKVDECKKEQGFTRAALLPILETAVVNDGNPVFYQQGGLNKYVLKVIAELEKTTLAQKQDFKKHEETYSEKLSDLQKKGTAIYREKNWPRVRALLDDFFVPHEKHDAVAFLMHEIKRPRKLPPPQLADFEELVNAYDTFREASRFKSNRFEHSNIIARNETFREILSGFYRSNKCFILAYDNRQAVLAETTGIADAKGDPTSVLYKRHGMRDRLTFSKRFTPS